MSKSSQLIIGSVAFLLLLGLLSVWSSSIYFAWQYCEDSLCYVKHNLIFGILPGLFLSFLTYKFFPWQNPYKISFYLFLFFLFLNALVIVPGLYVKVGVAKRWLKLGPITFQPSEFLKLGIILYLSALLSSPRLEKLKIQSLLLIPLLLFVIFGYFQKDKGTLWVLLFIFVSLLWLSFRTKALEVILITLLGVLFFLAVIFQDTYSAQRFLAFLNPELDPLGVNWQIQQAKIAIGSGGLLGKGLGLSTQKRGFLPTPYTDSIFAVLAEETGFLGASFLLLLYLILFWGIWQTSRKFPAKVGLKEFYRLLSLGILAHLFLQFFLNIGSLLRLVPFTGIPLPFISYGGTHLVVELIEIGMLLRLNTLAHKS